MELLFIGGLGTSEILLIVLALLLLFGGKKLPEMMRGLGQGVRNFKEGMNETASPEDKKEEIEHIENKSQTDNSQEA